MLRVGIIVRLSTAGMRHSRNLGTFRSLVSATTLKRSELQLPKKTPHPSINVSVPAFLSRTSLQPTAL